MRAYQITGYLTQMQRDELRDKRRKRMGWCFGAFALLCLAGGFYLVVAA